MLTGVMHKALLLSAALSLVLTFSPSVGAQTEAPADKPAVQQAEPNEAAQEQVEESTEEQVEEAAQDQTAEKRKKITEEAVSAIRETQNALKALDEEKNEDAIAALEKATGKLEIILAREPSLALAPASVTAITYDVVGTVDAVNAIVDEAEEALEDGEVQEARRLIGDLASETVIRVSNIPLATYPDAIKLAVGMIDDDEIEDAKQVLQTALNTLVITDTIIPLPVTAAQVLLKKAETLAEKSDRDEAENERLADFLKVARSELEFAQALGYGSEGDFDNLYEQLDEIEEKTEGGKSGEGFFAKINEFLADTVESSQPEQPEQSDQN